MDPLCLIGDAPGNALQENDDDHDIRPPHREVSMIRRALVAGARYVSYARWLSMTRVKKNTGWILPYRDTNVFLENLCDFLTTRDLLVGRHYQRLSDLAKSHAVVWDIGMNIGAVSLMFANDRRVDRVYGYEPMPHTFDCAMKSLSINPSLAAKIEAVNRGVGADDRDLQVEYSSKVKSAIGMSEIPPFLKLVCGVKPGDFTSETMHLSDADTVLRGIRERHPESQILMKLDAEGAEYEIIDRLVETGSIREISAATIEWHGSPGPEPLLSKLHDNGFRTTMTELEPTIGLIDAWQES